MKPEAILKELERICAELDNPNASNIAGRLESMRYETLPQLLCTNRLIILKALKQLCQKDTQLELNVPTQLQTCKHGTPFRYECDECVEEIESHTL